MPGLVGVEATVRPVGDALFQRALQQAQPQQPFGEGLDGGIVDAAVRIAGA